MAASLPPSSRVTRLRVPAELAMTFLPVAVEPVKLIFAMSGCSVIVAPISLPPETTLSTPAGKTCCAISPNRRVPSGV